jgi:hypothetical protein
VAQLELKSFLPQLPATRILLAICPHPCVTVSPPKRRYARIKCRRLRWRKGREHNVSE